MKKFTLIVFLMITVAIAKSQQAPQNIYPSYNEKGFIGNKGQIRDFSGKPASAVKYIYSHRLFNLELKENGFSYELFHAVADSSAMDESGYHIDDDEQRNPSLHLEGSSRIDVILEGANPNAAIIASDPTGAYFNFYKGPVITNKIEQVNAYNTISYRNIYPGIDLVFSAPDEAAQTPLHYDFIIHPGADPTAIQLKYKGASDLSMNEDGSLLLRASAGFVEEGKPASFIQSGKEEIISAYAINKNRVSYIIGEYDHKQTLVIDPTLVWGTYFGGEDAEVITEVGVDSKKCPSITGNTLSTTNIATSGAYQTVNAGGLYDLFVAKFKTSGKLDWASYFGGSSEEESYTIVVDDLDNVVIEGKTTSDGLATMGQTIRAGSYDAIIAKFSPSGILQWSTYKGGPAKDYFRNGVSDKEGNLYFAGYSSGKGVATANSFQPENGGFGDGLIAKFTPSGNTVWCTYFGTDGQDRFHAANLDLNGHLLVMGTTGSTTGLTTPGVQQVTYGGGEEDVMLAEFDTAGNRIWCTYYGGEYSDRGRGVESDSSGNIYIAGFTDSETGIATPGAHQEQWTPGYDDFGVRQEDGYLAKFTPTGQLIWGTYYGGSGYDDIWGLTMDRKSHFLYAVGGTLSEDSIATPGAWQQTKMNQEDGFFSKWDYDGNIIWGSYLGTNSDLHLEDVKTDKKGFIYMTGLTQKMYTTPGVYQINSNGGSTEVEVYKFYTGLDCYDINEPNNTYQNAKQISAWFTSDSSIYGYSGGIVNGDDQDWFSIKVKSAYPNIMIILGKLTHNYDLKLYNHQKVLLQSSTNSGITNDTIISNGMAAGNYLIKIDHASSEYDSLNCYLLQAIQSSDIFIEPAGVNKFSSSDAELLDLSVFPNPASEQLSFNVTSAASGKAVLIIYDLPGRIVKTNEVNLQEGFQTLIIPVADVPAGTYKLMLKSQDVSRVASFVKQ